MSFTLLLTCAGGDLSAQAVCMMKQSRRHRIKVVAVDMRNDVPARLVADHFATVPRGDAPEYVDALCKIIEAHDVNLVLPGSDEEALALSPIASRLAELGATLACAPAATLQLLADKDAIYHRLRDEGLPTPKWRCVAARNDLEGVVKEYFEAFGELALKPVHSRGNRDVIVIRRDVSGVSAHYGTRELHMDLETFFADHLERIAELVPVLVMERLYEPCYDLDALAWQGKALRVVPRRRLNPVGMPFMGNVIEPRADLLELGENVIHALNLSWLYDIDLMTDRDGRPVIIEINPRPSGSLTASVAAGIPLLDDLVSLAKGESLPSMPPIQERLVLPYTALFVS